MGVEFGAVASLRKPGARFASLFRAIVDSVVWRKITYSDFALIVVEFGQCKFFCLSNYVYEYMIFSPPKALARGAVC